MKQAVPSLRVQSQVVERHDAAKRRKRKVLLGRNRILLWSMAHIHKKKEEKNQGKTEKKEPLPALKECVILLLQYENRVSANYRAQGRVQVPIYEYACSSCKRQYQKLILRKAEEEEVVCPHCGGRGKKRLISRVAYHVSEQDRLDAYRPQDSRDDAFFKDSRNIGLSAKKRARDLGVDLGKGFEEKLEKLRSDPASVIKDSE